MLVAYEQPITQPAGAYQFTIKPGINTVVEVDAHIFLRDDVERAARRQGLERVTAELLKQSLGKTKRELAGVSKD